MIKPVRIDECWRKHLASEFEQPYFAQLREFVCGQYAARAVYPPAPQFFRAFDECPLHAYSMPTPCPPP